MNSRKGIEMALGVVITVVVLVVVSLAVITITTRTAGETGADAQTQVKETNCQIAIRGACAAKGVEAGAQIDATSATVSACTGTSGVHAAGSKITCPA